MTGVSMLAAGVWLLGLGATVESLPTGAAPPALIVPHFPSRVHTFVWRNWECANLDRMGEVVGATPAQVAAVGESMGLPPHRPVSDDELARSYIGIIRRNWHLLPYDQLLTLLHWDADRLAYTLREDDFLWHKLGQLKPACEPVKYAPPDEAAMRRCEEIRGLVAETFDEELRRPAEPRFAFVWELSAPVPDATTGGSAGINPAARRSEDDPIRFLYSYFAVYGDPLVDEKLNPYPDGLLQRLRAVGVNGVWLHVVLRQLAPATDFPEFGEGWQTRLANLRKLVERAGRHGIKIYLYMNEPRAMPAAFFTPERDSMKGVVEGEYVAMCTSSPAVRGWITDALRRVFAEVPDLGGVFTITGSENLTNCWSHYNGGQCPRCSKRMPAEVVAEINAAIAEGVRAGSPKARTLVWDWGWKNEWCDSIIAALPKDVLLMSVSEWDLPINRGGVATTVGEYSLSAVGPGPRAKHNWESAKKAGLKTVAKIQANCTWELSAVPYLPVMDLVARHCEGLVECGVDGMMLSWTLGGCPSPNLELVNMFSRRPAPTAKEALRELAIRRYGPKAAEHVLAAWSAFSRGFSEFPYHGSFLYGGPMQVGPANLLYAEPTGYHATMVGFPYDDVNHWRTVYPAPVFVGQLTKVVDGWGEGLEIWRRVVEAAEAPQERENARRDAGLARAAFLHLQSAVHQARFTLARNALKSATQPAERDTAVAEMARAARDETSTARDMFGLTRGDSRIGYEASNHYYYYPFDLVEKVINCGYILDNWLPKQARRSQ
ncbi:MAG: hypothetical protein HY718_19765 [Planctomycetes bacterium]|nr:hypothetical protein [Planctomycetota bacterium]